MKRQLIILLTLLSSVGLAQQHEFPLYENGLIYDSATMQRLGHIVDSMNLRFRNCEPQTYSSLHQGYATFVKIPSAHVRNQLGDELSWSEFEKRYGHLIVARNCWIIRSSYTDWEGRAMVSYRQLPSDGNTESIILPNTTENIKSSGWIVSKNGKQAFFLHQLASYTLPLRYGHLVQYVDCMIDTTATIFLGKKHRDSRFSESPDEVHAFMEMVLDFPNRPTPPDWDADKEEVSQKEAESYYKEFARWDSLRRLAMRNRMKEDPTYLTRLREAMDAALQSESSNDEFEAYVAEFISKKDALRLKRHREVWGSCSMDLSPRNHAVNICLLAAQTMQWDIFLRSHLDIMNDNVHRVSDGSWAWKGRNTYLRELEELDINAVDLLLGTCIRVENVSDNHYNSSIGRVGRALAEASAQDELEAKLLSMILDEELDLYNRLLISYLFSNYLHNLDDEARMTGLRQQLDNALLKCPTPIREAWDKSK